MKWYVEDYRKTKKKYPNIFREVSKHGHFFQARSDYGDVSKMHKTRESALNWAKQRNKTKTFNVVNRKDFYK